MYAAQETTMFNLSHATKCGVAFLAMVMLASVPSRTYADNGSIRMRISKVGFIVGVGGGSGVLTFKGRPEPALKPASGERRPAFESTAK
jgi:hypothetical protein